MQASEALIAQMPRDVIAVSESGLKTRRRTSRGCSALGYRAFLIGERFMTAQPDPGAGAARAPWTRRDAARGDRPVIGRA